MRCAAAFPCFNMVGAARRFFWRKQIMMIAAVCVALLLMIAAVCVALLLLAESVLYHRQAAIEALEREQEEPGR